MFAGRIEGIEFGGVINVDIVKKIHFGYVL